MARFLSGRRQPEASAPPDDWQAPTWEELVRDYSPQVYRLAYRLTGNRYDAEDLTQDVFVKVFKSIHTFTPGTLDGWLHRITTNQFLDQARRRNRLRMDLVDDSDQRYVSDEASPDHFVTDAQFDADVAAALASLPPEHRVAVVLCDIEGLSYQEIADVLDLKVGTVRSRIHRGREALRTQLAHRRPTDHRERYLGFTDDLADAEVTP